jgi:hypothetical protein
MSRNTINVLIYHRHKLSDFTGSPPYVSVRVSNLSRKIFTNFEEIMLYCTIRLHVICLHFLFRRLTCNLKPRFSLSNINFEASDDDHISRNM